MSFFNKLLNQAADALRSPAPSVEGPPFQFDDSAASTIIVEPPSKILEHAVRELQGMGEGNLGRKLEVSRYTSEEEVVRVELTASRAESSETPRSFEDA